MSVSYILLGLLPLVAFVVIDAFLGLKAGVLAAFVLAGFEAIYTIYEFGALDSLSIVSLVLVLIFGLFSLQAKNAIYMKMQPVFLGICFGCIVLVLQAINRPVLLLFLSKYGSLLPAGLRVNVQNPLMQNLLARVSFNLGIGFLVHASLVAYAAFRMSNWWWLFIRGIGLYVMMAICVVVARIF